MTPESIPPPPASGRPPAESDANGGDGGGGHRNGHGSGWGSAPVFRSLMLAALALLLAGVALALHRPVAPGGWHDDGVYLLLGKALASGEGFVYRGVPGDPPAAKFPPGYPAVAAGLWWLAGQDLDRTALLASLLNLVAVVASGVALAHLALLRFALPLPWALCAGLAFGLLLDPWVFALLSLSESLAVLVAIVAVDVATAAERAPRAQGGRAAAGALGLFTVAIHLRSASLPLGPAVALACALRGNRRRAVALGLGVVLVTLPWMVLSALRTGRIPSVLRDILGGYGGWWTALALGDPGGFLAGRVRQVGVVAGHLLSVVAPWGRGGAEWVPWGVALLLLALLVPGCVALWRSSRTAALLLLGLAIQGVFWPFVDRRLLLPLHPWIVLACALGLRHWATVGSGGRRRGRRLVPLVGLLWLVGLAHTLGRAGSTAEGIAGALRGREAITGAAVAAVRDWVPPGRVVGAPELWAILHLRTGHPVAPSARFRPGAAGLERAGTPEEQFRLWAVAGFDALVAEGEVHDEALRVMREACGPGAFTVPAAGPGFRLVRLEWDDACRRRLVPGWGGGGP